MTDWLTAVAERAQEARRNFERKSPTWSNQGPLADDVDRLVAIARGVQRERTPEAIRDEIQQRGICTDCWTEGHFSPRLCQCWNDE